RRAAPPCIKRRATVRAKVIEGGRGAARTAVGRYSSDGMLRERYRRATSWAYRRAIFVEFLWNWLCVQGNQVRVSSAKMTKEQKARPDKQKDSASFTHLARPLTLIGSAYHGTTRATMGNKAAREGRGNGREREAMCTVIRDTEAVLDIVWTLMDVRHFHRDLGQGMEKSSHFGAYTHECRRQRFMKGNNGVLGARLTARGKVNSPRTKQQY
ncbi:hypothetical protein CCMA1212_003900, partial [Trichoderma ghanense]